MRADARAARAEQPTNSAALCTPSALANHPRPHRGMTQRGEGHADTRALQHDKGKNQPTDTPQSRHTHPSQEREDTSPHRHRTSLPYKRKRVWGGHPFIVKKHIGPKQPPCAVPKLSQVRVSIGKIPSPMTRRRAHRHPSPGWLQVYGLVTDASQPAPRVRGNLSARVSRAYRWSGESL